MRLLDILFRRRACADELSVQLEPMRYLLSTLKESIMTALEDLNAKADALAAEVTAANAKTDQVLTALADTKQQLADLLANSSGSVSDADLQAVAAKLDATLASVKGEETKEDAALAPAPAPAESVSTPEVATEVATSPAVETPATDTPAA